MTAKKQTAVMWLISKFPSYVVKEYQDEFDKALQMEREQIEEAYGDGYCDRHSDELTINNEIKKLKP